MTQSLTLQTPDLLAALKTFDLFEGVDDATLRQLAAHSRIVEYSEPKCIFRENDLSEHVYLIMSGLVDLVICRPDVGCRRLMQLGAGELLGWSPLVQRPRLSASAIVSERITAIEIDAAQIARLNQENPEFFCNFMSHVARIVAQRLSATRLQMLDMCGVRLPEVQIESD